MNRTVLDWGRRLALVVVVAAVVVNCSATSESGDGAGGNGASGGDGGSGGFTDASSDAPTLPVGARINGTVWGPHAPNSGPLFPVSAALVAAYEAIPDPIPDGVYCEECVALPSNLRFTRSGPDGTFQLDLEPGKTYWLTVQKGQFRRIREYTAPSEIGDYSLDAELSTLPGRTRQGFGDTAPKVALVYGDYDHVEDVFAKADMGDGDGAYGLAWGTETFDVYDNSGPGETAHGWPLNDLLSNPARLDQYHVIVFACSYNANFAFMGNAANQQALRDWVWKGGKLYVSDYAMPVAEMPWPEFAWFTDPLHGGCQENQFPPNCNHGPPFDAPAQVPDGDMRAWLEAMGEYDTLETKENWNTIGAIAEGQIGNDPSTGAPLRAEPKVWVEGGWSYTDQQLTDVNEDPATFDRTTPHPMTISWPYNCGRVLYTTYHTVGGTQGGRHPGLLPQEMMLFYLLMEITVCQDIPVVR